MMSIISSNRTNFVQQYIILLAAIATMSVNARYLWSSIGSGSVVAVRYHEPTPLTEPTMVEIDVSREFQKPQRAKIPTKLVSLVQSFEEAIPCCKRRTEDIHVGRCRRMRVPDPE